MDADAATRQWRRMFAVCFPIAHNHDHDYDQMASYASNKYRQDYATSEI
jgi:hypothetical protein